MTQKGFGDEPQKKEVGGSSAKSTTTVFVRETTGLVKTVSFLDAVMLNIANMSAGAALAVLGFTLVNIPEISGLNLVIASLIALALSVPQVIVYTILTQKIPKTGGDYVWISRALGGWIGAPLSFAGYTMETLAYLALIAISTVFAIGSVGVALGFQNMLGLALPGGIPGSQPLSQMLIAWTIYASLIALNIVRPKAGYKLVSAFTLFGILTTILGILVILYAGRPGIASYINSLGAGISYQQLASSYKGGFFSLYPTIFVLPFFAAFVYPWVNAAPAVASEIKGKSALKWNIAISSVIVALLLTSALGVMYYIGGMGFVNMAMSNPKLVFDYSFNFWTLAMGVAPNAFLSWLIGLGWIVWSLGILAYGIIVFARYAFAQAFDRYLPEKLAYISPKYGSPVTAHLVDLLVTIALVGLAVYFYGSLQALFGAVMISMAYFAFVGIAAAIHSKKQSGITKRALFFCGMAMAAIFSFIVYQIVSNPGVWGVNELSYSYVVFELVLGFLIYAYSKRINAKKGVNIDLAFKEIPPD